MFNYGCELSHIRYVFTVPLIDKLEKKHTHTHTLKILRKETNVNFQWDSNTPCSLSFGSPALQKGLNSFRCPWSRPWVHPPLLSQSSPAFRLQPPGITHCSLGQSCLGTLLSRLLRSPVFLTGGLGGNPNIAHMLPSLQAVFDPKSRLCEPSSSPQFCVSFSVVHQSN